MCGYWRSHAHAEEGETMNKQIDKHIFIQNDTRYIIIKELGTYYHLVLKNIKDKDEIFVVSLFNLGSKMNEKIRRLEKKYKKK